MYRRTLRFAAGQRSGGEVGSAKGERCGKGRAAQEANTNLVRLLIGLILCSPHLSRLLRPPVLLLLCHQRGLRRGRLHPALLALLGQRGLSSRTVLGRTHGRDLRLLLLALGLLGLECTQLPLPALHHVGVGFCLHCLG